VVREVRQELEHVVGRRGDDGRGLDFRRGFVHAQNVSLREVSTEAFESIAARVDYPMFVVTTATAGGERAGCLVGFATQCSIDPARFLACISDKNLTYRVLRRASAMAVHLVPEHADHIVELFGGETGDDTQKFERTAWRPGPDGLPLLEDCPSWFAGRILERVPLGDHVGHLIEPFAGEDGGRDGGGWFPFSRAKRIEPGHEA
jgi:flavin reductase (DIM6/NTAB) family NADH-FMN oxidoreductase RutF